MRVSKFLNKKMKKIKIELTEEDAEIFKWFRRYQSVWEQARKLRPGRLVLHFNNKNEIKHKEFHFYSDRG